MTTATTDATARATLEGRGIGMDFGGVKALVDVDVALSPGTRLGLIGPNGSGKTTLLNVLSGVYRPTAGAIAFGERTITGLSPGARGRLGIVRTFQHPQLAASLSVRENVELGAGLARKVHGRGHRADVDGTLAEFGCADYADGLPDEVPYGVRKMVEIARAVVVDGPVLLLDEPAAGLSREERDELIAALQALRSRRPELALCLVEHDVRLVAALCDELLVLATGRRLAAGVTDEVLQDEAVRAAYLGEQALEEPAASSPPETVDGGGR
ncbi:MAG: ABC transporter ATP-binding protein [Solirubrobacteraceae bacterium]